jgi:hypothetical protein
MQELLPCRMIKKDIDYYETLNSLDNLNKLKNKKILF